MGPSHPTPQSLEVRGAALHYVEQGSGAPVVFVHGTLGDYRAWAPQMPHFAERYRGIAYSRRYHWPNAWTGDGLDYSAALHADDLAALLDALGAAPAHVVSSSYGSYVALVHALRRPEQVRSLVVAEPPMMQWLAEMEGGRELAETFRLEMMEPATAACARGDSGEAVALFVDGVYGVPGAFRRFPRRARTQLMDNARELCAELRSPRLFPPFGCADATRITAPTLLLDGENSPRRFRRITDELAACLPHAERVTIAGVSHVMNAGRPRVYNEVALEFLARH